MGLSPERRLVVKNSFYEVVDKPGNRMRAVTDTFVEYLRLRGEDEETRTQSEAPAQAEVGLAGFPSQGSRRDLRMEGKWNRRPGSSERQQAPVVVHLDSAVAPLKQFPNVNRGLPLSLERSTLASAVGPPGAHPALPSLLHHNHNSSAVASQASSSKCKAPMWPVGKLELSACLPSDSWGGGKCNPRQRSGLHSGQELGQLGSNAPIAFEASRQLATVQSSQMNLPYSGGPDSELLARDVQSLPCGTDPRTELTDHSILSESSLATSANGLPMTTVMLRNLPNRYTRAMLLAMLDEEGFKARYDFVYLPIDFKTHSGLGYAFVDLCEPAVAEHLRQHFEGFSRWCIQSDKVCTVSWSHQEQQGLAAHIKRYRNSPVMHGSVPDDWKPMLFQDGQPVPFPPPQRKLRAPHMRPAP